ncbi:butyrophilin subfamily 1 member A1-like [Tyto alba]|uniref:butyrophilin subfamily 1 member A1-like n=1 Tax=Tyto alba TaxID=56313 RepID=UPI001C67766D|nr:butyrophilin subfamily 1 member A1-like [Tyto alba]
MLCPGGTVEGKSLLLPTKHLKKEIAWSWTIFSVNVWSLFLLTLCVFFFFFFFWFWFVLVLSHYLLSEFRKARGNADDIKIDGDTAHPNLSVTVDKKSFTHKSQVQKVMQKEESFDSSVCVLGSEGFSSGKHYWEVDVEKSNDWDLGVARKSAPRKGIFSFSPKEGFWALGLYLKGYWARTDPWTRVEVQKSPRKVGVYLNYEEKTLTFFNVTDMSVMFMFKDCAFSEEVYPFFKNSAKESTMRVCSVKEE